MENASKALIIAGAILISILLISVGVIIMNSTGNTQKTVEDTAVSTEVRSFNSQLTPYGGNDQSASQVRSLLNTAKSMLASGKTVNVYKGTGSGTLLKETDLKSNQKYDVYFDYDTSGYISAAHVTGGGF